MTSQILIIVLAGLLVVTIVVGIALWSGKRRVARRISRLNQEMLEASKDASVGRRLTIPKDPESAQFVQNINRLFDALGAR